MRTVEVARDPAEIRERGNVFGVAPEELEAVAVAIVSETELDDPVAEDFREFSGRDARGNEICRGVLPG